MKTVGNKKHSNLNSRIITLGAAVGVGLVSTGGGMNNYSTIAHADTIKTKSDTNLKKIAKENHVDVSDLAKANKVKKNHKVEKGTTVKVPTSYTVKKGDTVSGIAKKLNIKTQDLLDKNNMTWQNATIHVGEKLNLKDKKKPQKVVTKTQQVQTTQTNAQPQVQQTNTVQAPNSSSVVANALQIAKMNVPYVYGGTSLSGFDCSGFVQYAERAAGVNVGRTTVAQEANTIRKPVSQAQPGDLLFWGAPGASSHVAIYIGNGQYVHSPAPGQSVTVGSIAAYAPNFAGTVVR